MEPIARIRALTGITTAQIPDVELEAILDMNDGAVFCAAADAADRIAASLIAGSGVTSVEDISIDRTRPIERWSALADRLRARCDREADEQWDDGPAVVEFYPRGYGAPEAVERHV